ncbi:MAG: agmatinase [Clostridium sp.]|nr:agmatinase [Clostridium sp.]
MTLKNKSSTLSTKFMASVDSYEQALMILVGVPMDFTCSFRPGARFGPQKIREVSMGLEEYSIHLDRALDEFTFYDAGDLDLPIGDLDGSFQRIENAASEIITDNKFPLFVGGEHSISVPIIKKVYEKYGDDLIVLHFDAHADLRQDYLGYKNSHASAIRRLTDFMPGKNIYQFGIRSGTKEEFDFANKHTNMFTLDVAKPLEENISKIKNRPIYITLDIDVLDPAYANGTGTPEPGGITSLELFKSIRLLKGLNIIGFDLVEVSPHYDLSDRTALVAAKIIREIIIIVGCNMCN